MSMQSVQREQLAIYGGAPAKQRPNPPMYPGGMSVGQEEEEAVLETLRSKRLFRHHGPGSTTSKVAELEQAFSAHMGARHALAVTSGTAALICGLQGVGVGPGDEVIIPAYTWIASATAVLAVGGIPIIAEVDESLTLDPHDVAEKISPHTRAIMPVHMRGVPCQMDALMALARHHGLKVVEDTAQADGGSYHGQRLGTFGDAGCFSLQFNKIITSGEGGMVLTNDENVWKRAAMYHDVISGRLHGVPEEELLWGTNFRMPELTAAVALVQLKRLDGLLEQMRLRRRMLEQGMEEIAQRKGITFRHLLDPDGDTAIALVFFVKDQPTAVTVVDALRAENVGAGLLYHPDRIDDHVYASWTPVLEKRTWTPNGGPWRWAKREIEYHREMCPRSLDLLGRAVHLDVSPLLTNEDIEETVEGVNKVLEVLA
jgi:8-amino-3,8-dideoxy-alpha-D-manno-octulosonate transaminase